MAVGTGFVVRYLLSHQGPPFPANYAWLFVLAGSAFLISVGFILLVREAPGPTSGDRVPWRAYLPRLAGLLVKDADLRLAAIENVPKHFYEEAMLGLPGRDEQIEHMQNTVRNMGEAGIPIFGYNWMPNSVWRTSRETLGRGGAFVTSFDYDLAKDKPLTHGRVYTEEEMWDSYTYFIKAMIPVAEESGVKMGIHPDDPPVESLGGVARIFRNFEGFKRAMEIVDSDCHGLEFCQGCWTEMGEDVCAAIRYFGERGRILYVHFRNVIGTAYNFRESFINAGDVDMYEAMRP